MAGGKFISMNKTRPGAYINFETSASDKVSIGTRGIATLALALDWGKESAITEITGDDMLSNKSLAKIGILSTDADALLINLALQNCSSVKVFNTSTGGSKAYTVIGQTTSYVLTQDIEIVIGKTYYTRSGAGTEESPYVYTPVAEPDASALSTYYEQVVSEGTTITAKYPGTFGNKIAILVRAIDTKYVVETYADGYLVDSQKVSAASQLVANDYVTFEGSVLVEVSSTLLTGGTTGATPSSTTYLATYFNALRLTKWNTMAYNGTSSDDIQSIIQFIRTMREDEGKYVQAVVANYNSADYEGIINNINGVILEDDTTITAAQFTAWVAGATAGADITESNTGKVVDNAVSIVGLLTNDQIIEGLQLGKFILSFTQDGKVKVEKDINSLHSFTVDKGYVFSKNRIIRELDEIGSYIENIWETTYLGKVSNNENGRTLFKSSIIDYLTDLQNRGAIQEFDSSQVEVLQGDDIDSVIANLSIKPVDSMEFLYMTVVVEQ